MPELASYLGIGAVVGFFAGLLGIGGGIITVSALGLMFAAQGFPADYIMQLAIGTSLAAIISGSWSSFRAHHRRQSVDWPTVRAMTPGLLAGVVSGVLIARVAPHAFLKYFFLAFTLFVTAQMVLNLRPAPSPTMPRPWTLGVTSVVIGVVSGLMGGGAAAVSVPFFTWRNMTMHRAIGTAAALGFPIAIAGTAGYAMAGWSVAGLPRWSVGFVYVPAFVGISVMSVLLAPVGVRAAHALKGATLRRIFALVLVAMATKMVISV